MIRSLLPLNMILAALWAASPTGAVDDVTPEQAAFFEQKVRPVF